MSKTQALYVNNARTTLGSSITPSSVSFTVGSVTGFPTSLTGGQYFYVTLFDNVNIEIVKVTAVSGSTFTVSRAQQGTTANSFAAASTTVGQRATASDFASFARLDDRMGSLSSITALTDPADMNGNSYVLGDTAADGSFIVAIANTNNNLWSFLNYPAAVYAGTVGASATTTVINLATASTILPDQGSLVYIVQLTSGSQQGSCRLISSISSSSFTVSSAWASAPSNTDGFTIYRHIGTNVLNQVIQTSQLLDPAYVTSTINYIAGEKRLNAGSFQMYDGTSWNNYVLNYVASTTATIGSYSVAAVNGGYAGFDFTGAYHSQAFLASSTAKSSGVQSTADSTWDWRWDAGVLAVGTVPYANLSGTPDLTVYAPKVSPALTGTPTAPTASTGTNTTQIATTAFVHNSTVSVTGSATSGTRTYITSGLIEQWTEVIQSAAGGTAVSISYPSTFPNTYAVPRVTATNLSATDPTVNNFVGVTVKSYSASGCTVYVGSVPSGSGTVTITVDVKGT